MRVLPETLRETWQREADLIANQNPKLSQNRAGELAAARVLNWYYAEWAPFEENIRQRDAACTLTDDDPDVILYDRLYNWTPARELQEMSGSRSILIDLDEPLANA